MAKKKRAKSKKPAAPAARAIQSGARFTVNYPNPAALVVAGPFLRASFMRPRVAIESNPPKPIHGALLADTGASSTCISESVAKELGLRAIDTRKTYGAAGLHESKVYFARLEIRIQSPDGQTIHQLAIETQMTGIPRLEEHYASFPDAPRLIGLFGRDLMRHCKITYDGPNHEVMYEFDMSALAAKQ